MSSINEMMHEPLTRSRSDSTSVLFQQGIEQRLSRIRIQSALWSGGLLCLLSLFFGLSHDSNYKDSIWEKAALSLAFKVQNFFGKDLPLSPKLKIFLLEDHSVGRLNSTSLNLEQWQSVFENLNSLGPAAVYVDQIFGLQGTQREKIQSFVDSLSRLGTPVYSAAFASDSSLAGWEAIAPEKLRPAAQIRGDEAAQSISIQQFAYGYGASRPMSQLFAFGHVVQSGETSFMPFVRIGAKGELPHLGISFVYNTQTNRPKQPPLDQKVVPVPFVAQASLLKQSYPLDLLVRNSSALKKIVSRGDHVLVVPGAFTGSADFKDTPIGRMIGGFIVASVINATLTSNWITTFDTSHFIAHLLILVGFVIGLLYGSRGMFFCIGSALLIAISGILLFVEQLVFIPWLEWSTVLLISGSTVGTFKIREQSERARLLTQLNALLSVENHFEKERRHLLLRERREAMLVAQTFRPEQLPEDLSIPQIFSFFQSADEASGDWFFVRKSSCGRNVHIVMCDVVGHGMHAAMIVACCKAALSTLEHSNPNGFENDRWAEEYLLLLNRILFTQGNGLHCATFCSVSYNTLSSVARVITCGHPPVLLISNTENEELQARMFRSISSHCDVIGMSENVKISSIELTMGATDSLLLYTDGLPIVNRFHLFKKISRDIELNRDFPRSLVTKFWNEIFDKSGERCDDDISVILCNFSTASLNRNDAEAV